MRETRRVEDDQIELSALSFRSVQILRGVGPNEVMVRQLEAVEGEIGPTPFEVLRRDIDADG